MTLMQTTMQAATNEEILRARDEGGVEFVGGRLVEKPVSAKSSHVGSRVNFLLQMEATKTVDAFVYDSSLGYQCYRDEPRKFRKPDVSIIRSERLKGLPEDVGLMPIPADLAIEVNSPTDLASDVQEKVEEYLEAEFRCVWVIDPPSRSVTIYRLDGSVARLREKDEITGELALPSFKCKVSEFFERPA